MNDITKMRLFIQEFTRLRDRTPTPAEKAIALQRFDRGQSIREVIDTI